MRIYEKKLSRIHYFGLFVFLFSLIVFFFPVESEAASQAAKAKKTYRKMLEAKMLNWGDHMYPTSSMKFSCVDMNGDKIPELVVFYNNSYGYEGTERVYTYYKGKVRRIFMSDNCQSITKYYKKKGIFVETGGRMGVGLTRYVKISKGKATVIASASIPIDTSYSKSYYTVKGKKVSKSQYKKYVKKQLGSSGSKKMKLYSNTKKNRKKYI